MAIKSKSSSFIFNELSLVRGENGRYDFMSRKVVLIGLLVLSFVIFLGCAKKQEHPAGTEHSMEKGEEHPTGEGEHSEGAAPQKEGEHPEGAAPQKEGEHPEGEGHDHDAEHPAEGGDEHPEAKAAPRKPLTIAELAEAIESYVKDETELKGGHFVVYDDEAQETLKLKLKKIHKDKLAKIEDQVYFACADFETTEGKVYDLDVFMEGPSKDELKVTEITVHKESGEARYTWHEEEGIWKKKYPEGKEPKKAKTEAKEAEHPSEHPTEHPE